MPSRRHALAVPLLAVLIAAGACGDDAPGGAGTVRTVEVAIAAGSVTPAPARIEVGRGATVRVTVTSDVADTVHVHGYDREFLVRPGETAGIEFVADDAGLYEVETHDQELQLFQLVVR